MVHLSFNGFGFDMTCEECGKQLMSFASERAAFLNADVVVRHDRECPAKDQQSKNKTEHQCVNQNRNKGLIQEFQANAS